MPNIRRVGLAVLALALIMSALSATPLRAVPLPTICLFTDYGWDDPYVAQLKGVIVTTNPNARILDLIHSVEPFNISEGAYLLDQSAQEFPAGTIFIAVVDPGVGTGRDGILIETNQQKYYVGPDNGLFSRVLEREGLMRAWRLDKPEFFRPGDPSHTFHGRDIFAPIAARLSSGTDPDQLGTIMKTLQITPDREPVFNGGLISTEVLHVDGYGNIILNLRGGSDLASRLRDGNLVKISVGRENFSAPLVKTFGDVDKGRLLLLYGGNGQLEIAMNQGSAAHRLNVEAGATVYLKP